MPKRSERDLYSNAFKGNPYEGKTLAQMYDSLRWGNPIDSVSEIDAPEPMVAIGTVAALHYRQCVELYEENTGPYLAVGSESNMLYVIPRDFNDEPFNVPSLKSAGWRRIDSVSETHYYSDKGDNQNHYYYHEHQNPLPIVYEHRSGVKVIVPANNRGKRSYAVDSAGIIG